MPDQLDGLCLAPPPPPSRSSTDEKSRTSFDGGGGGGGGCGGGGRRFFGAEEDARKEAPLKAKVPELPHSLTKCLLLFILWECGVAISLSGSV